MFDRDRQPEELAEFGRPGGHGIVVAGTPDECRATIQDFVAAGADTIVLRPVGHDPVGQLGALVH